MKGGVHLGNYSVGSRGPSAVAYIHESFGSHIGEYIVEDLKKQGLNVATDDTGCLCGRKIEDLNFDGHEIVLLNTLNGIGDDVCESVDCNEAVKKIILNNPETHFWLMDFGGEKFREGILGRPENLAYIRYRGFSVGDFMEEARALRR